MDTIIYITITLITHACKPPFKARAQQIDGTFAGVMSAAIFTLLSVVSLTTALLTFVSIVF